MITGAIIFVPGFLITTSPDKVRNWLKECSSLPMATKIKSWEGGCLVEGEIRGQRLKGKGIYGVGRLSVERFFVPEMGEPDNNLRAI
jgi:hypothetical protein